MASGFTWIPGIDESDPGIGVTSFRTLVLLESRRTVNDGVRVEVCVGSRSSALMPRRFRRRRAFGDRLTDGDSGEILGAVCRLSRGGKLNNVNQVTRITIFI